MPEEIATETPVVKEETEEKTDKELIAEEEAAAETEVEKEVTTEEATEEKPKKEKKEKKPLVLTSDWEEGKVYLYQSNRTPRIPSLFPRELLLESWMKLQGVPYENINLASRLSSKKERLPFVELDGEKMAGPDLLSKLAEKFEKNLSSHLSPEQLNIEHAMVKMVENHLYWFVMDWRTKTEDNTLKAYNLNLPAYFESKLPPAVLSLHFKLNVCKKVQKQRREQGLTNLAELAKQDLKVLSEMLAEKDFMFGSEVSMLDLVLFSVLALLAMVDPEYECEMRDWLAESHHNLLDFVTRLKEKVWADHWDVATGETLDLNPHIPKPEPEPEEKKEEEEVVVEVEMEKADEEKPVEEKTEDDKDGEKLEVVEEEKETEKKSILDSFRNLKSRVFSKTKKEEAGEPAEKTVEEEGEKAEEKEEEKPVEEKSEEDQDGEKVEVVEVVEVVEEKDKEKERRSLKASFKKLRTRVFSKAKKEDAGEPSDKTEVEDEKKDEEEEKKEETEEKTEDKKDVAAGETKEEEKTEKKTDQEKKD